MRWITRERPHVDGVACGWLVSRFIDPEAEFIFAPVGRIWSVIESVGAIPYDVPDVELGHHGELCSFDAFLEKYVLRDPALARMAPIVRGAATSRISLAPESGGLFAIFHGLAQNFLDDNDLQREGMLVCDALYVWCTSSAA